MTRKGGQCEDTSSSAIFFSSSGSTILNAWKCLTLIILRAKKPHIKSYLENLAESPVHRVERVEVQLISDVLHLKLTACVDISNFNLWTAPECPLTSTSSTVFSFSSSSFFLLSASTASFAHCSGLFFLFFFFCFLRLPFPWKR